MGAKRRRGGNGGEQAANSAPSEPDTLVVRGLPPFISHESLDVSQKKDEGPQRQSDGDGEWAEAEQGKSSALENVCVQAAAIQNQLKDELKQFRTEVNIFFRLLYKNKNQHRHGLYYRKMTQVGRDLRLLNFSKLENSRDNLTDLIRPTIADQDQSKDGLSLHKDRAYSALASFLGTIRLLSQLEKPVRAASLYLFGLLAQGFFMGSALTMVACLARLRLLAQQLVVDLSASYNLLTSYVTLNLPGEKTGQLPSHVVCHLGNGEYVQPIVGFDLTAWGVNLLFELGLKVQLSEAKRGEQVFADVLRANLESD